MKCPVCKKNIPQDALKCPYCKTRTGLLCSYCNTVNPAKNLTCEKCGNELLKICTKCGSVNFPSAIKCRKCGSSFGKPSEKKDKKIEIELEYKPDLYTLHEAVDAIINGIHSGKNIFSINGEKGVGKSSVLKTVIKSLEDKNYHWCIGRCTQLTQLTPGGVIQDMLLNLFRLPNFSMNNEELRKNAADFFSNEFKFLNKEEISDLFNFIYNYIDGNYEDIIINKKRTYSFLNKIFDAFASTERFIFVVDNFDFIDGFSAEFLTDFLHRQKNIKFIALYNECRPISAFFGIENINRNAYLEITLQTHGEQEIRQILAKNDYISEREKELIIEKCNGNLAYVEQAASYSFDCQITDKAFILPNNFSELIKTRLTSLKKCNSDAYKVLCGAAILGDKININLIKEIFGADNPNFNDIISYLVKAHFIRPYDDISYEFNNMLLWETILKNITRDSVFDDINIKIGKVISVFNLNTNATMAMIAHNLKETRMAFDIWTKTTRLASYVGDINLYVISQKQCLALLNEFNENETLKIRYNISEKLGKILSEYDPEEALEYLPDAISNAENENNEVKEIELLGYLTRCCQKTGNYFGNVECTNKVLKKLGEGQELEKAMVLTSKLSALLDIGNCGEVINLIDNDILPVLNANLSKPRLNKLFPMGILFDTWLKVYLALATALVLQGNNRAFEVLKMLFGIIDKHKITDKILIAKAQIVLAYANTMSGDFNKSGAILDEIENSENFDAITISRRNLVNIINKYMTKDYEGLRQDLFDAVTFANNSGDNFTKNILKSLLGKMFKDNQQAQRAIGIYNEQITYFSNEKMALGALLTWYLIADATIVTENSKSAIDIATQALEIAQNPSINNYFFIINLKMVLAKAYMNIADFETAKINIESALSLSKKYKMNDLTSRIYLLYGNYYKEMGSVASQKQSDFLRGAAMMYEKGMEIVIRDTHNDYVKDSITSNKNILSDFCAKSGIRL